MKIGSNDLNNNIFLKSNLLGLKQNVLVLSRNIGLRVTRKKQQKMGESFVKNTFFLKLDSTNFVKILLK